jgi:cobalt-zinc-cadmium efflux system membrane fusion protein
VFLDNPGEVLKPGMFARVAVSRSGEQALRVPRSAVVVRGQLEGVFVVNADDIASLRWIRLGGAHGDEVEVVAGLEAGEAVVTSGAANLLDGQKVKVTK